MKTIEKLGIGVIALYVLFILVAGLSSLASDIELVKNNPEFINEDANTNAVIQQTGAPSFPYIVNGNVKIGERVYSGAEVEICRLRPLECRTTETNKYGDYQFDLTSFNFHYPGLEYKVKVCEVGFGCEKKFIEDSSPGIKINFNIKDEKAEFTIKDEIVTLGEIYDAFKLGFWVTGFFALVGFWYIVDKKRAKKMWKTFLKKYRLGKYKK